MNESTIGMENPHDRLDAILKSGDKIAIDCILAHLKAIQERLLPAQRFPRAPICNGKPARR